MSQVSDVSIANQGFSAFRTELNNILGALNSMHSGTSRPSSATTGTMWLDTTNSGSNSLEIKFFDGSDDISVATILLDISILVLLEVLMVKQMVLFQCFVYIMQLRVMLIKVLNV